MTIARRARRPIAIIRECATGRVPLGLMPVTAATAAMTTAMPSHTSQFTTRLCYKMRATILLFIVFCGCAKHEVRYITPWLKIDIRAPAKGSRIVIGSSREIFYAKVRDEWVRLGTGHSSSYMSLAGDQAVLFDLHDGKGFQLVREGGAGQRVSFGHKGTWSVLPDREAIDIFDCRVPATPAGCREVDIYRYDVDGTLLATFPVALPDAYSNCQILKIEGYDKEKIPYVFAQCRRDSADAAKCVLVAPRKDALFVHAVGADRPWIECSEFGRAGISLRAPSTQ